MQGNEKRAASKQMIFKCQQPAIMSVFNASMSLAVHSVCESAQSDVQAWPKLSN